MNVINGTASADTLSLTRSGSTVTVTVNGSSYPVNLSYPPLSPDPRPGRQ